MRILQVNKFHYIRGGADKYYLDISKQLSEAGHKVANFSMNHPKNIASEYQKYFVSRISFNEKQSFLQKIKLPGRVIYSLEAKKKFKKLVKDFEPEIIHIHNIYHHLSPSILSVARKKKIPVVMHLHDYKLVCPNHTLFVGGKNCRECKPNRYLNCVKKRCLKDSFFASFLVAIEMYIHHTVLKIYKKNISLYITPSNYMKKVCLDFAWDGSKIAVLYNPYSNELLESNNINSNNSEKYILYFGRLGKEKGIDTLINALPATSYSLKVAGGGEEEAELKQKAKSIGANVEFLGHKSKSELSALINNAKAIVMPSIWQENMPLSLLEAMSMSKVVIASNIGGYPEIIEHGVNGMLFEPGNFRDLASKINSLEKTNLEEMGRVAKQRVMVLSPENNLKQLLSLYKKVLNY